jgi:hypothetical protein
MGPNQFYRQRLPEHLDANGDLAPPWERFPTYERYTIGWRMGVGESWLSMWRVFLDDLAPDFAVRLGYLRRHQPAPVNWWEMVYQVLHPSASDAQQEEEEAERRDALRQAGLIASDVAYPTWRAQQRDVRWPWEDAETPEHMARYWTRDFWFWSRRVVELRNTPDWRRPMVPEQWQVCAEPLKTGEVRSPDPGKGLLTLARMLCAGRVLPPWQLGLTPGDFTDSFADDMGYVDAFRLWGMSCFDDREQVQRYLAAGAAPAVWRRWCEERFPRD